MGFWHVYMGLYGGGGEAAVVVLTIAGVEGQLPNNRLEAAMPNHRLEGKLPKV
jgi:hypothetical protein